MQLLIDMIPFCSWIESLRMKMKPLRCMYVCTSHFMLSKNVQQMFTNWIVVKCCNFRLIDCLPNDQSIVLQRNKNVGTNDSGEWDSGLALLFRKFTKCDLRECMHKFSTESNFDRLSQFFYLEFHVHSLCEIG